MYRRNQSCPKCGHCFPTKHGTTYAELDERKRKVLAADFNPEQKWKRILKMIFTNPPTSAPNREERK